MSRLILERLVHSVFVVLGASVVVYMLLHFTGGDIAASMLPDWATSEQTKEYRRKLGLDLPIHLQYVHWLGGVARGDFGLSFRNDLPAMDLVLERFPATIQLALVAQVIALLVAFPLGVLAAIRRGSWWDRACMGLALMLILLIAVEARWLPVSGREGPQYIILPALTLATAPLAQLARLVRSGMLDMLGQDFVTTARAKGLQEVIVLSRHALANALLPLVTVIGLELGSLLNGSVVVENVFAWPGEDVL